MCNNVLAIELNTGKQAVRIIEGSMRDQGLMPAGKQDVRSRVWARLERLGVSRYPGPRGRIPNFAGADVAAALLAGEVEWRRAGQVEANPDPPQRPLRELALTEGKTLYVAQPRLRTRKPFLVIDPNTLVIPPKHAASIDGVQAAGDPIAAGDIPRIDVFVCGAVAVNPAGAVIGDGTGFGDIAAALAVEGGVIDEHTVFVTTVDEAQIVDEDLPVEDHDIRVDIIATPERIIRSEGRGSSGRSRTARSQSGIVWALLSDEQIRAMPALSALRREHDPDGPVRRRS